MFPAWFLTHAKDGTCWPISLANTSIFRLKDYETKNINGVWHLERGSLTHGWTEAYKEGQNYVLNNYIIYATENRERLYKEIGLEPDNSYNPDWFKES